MMAQGVKQGEIAKALGIGDRTIRRARNKLLQYGDIEGGAKKGGRKSKMTPQMIDVYLFYFRFLLILHRCLYH